MGNNENENGNEPIGFEPQEDYQSVSVEESNDRVDNNDGKKSKRRFIIILGTVIVLIVIAIGAICLAMNNFAKYTYFKLEKNQINKMVKMGEKLDDMGLARLIVPLTENTIKYDEEIAIQAKTEDTSAKQFVDVINGTKLILSQQVDYKAGYQSLEGQFSLGGDKMLTANAVIDNNTLFINIPEIYEKYFSADANNLAPVYELFGVKDTTGLPKKIINQKEALETITFTKNEERQIKKSINNYEKIINKNLKTDDFEIENNVELEYNGKVMKCKLVTMTVDIEEAKAISKEALQELKNDKSVDIIFDKLEKLKKMYEDAGYAGMIEAPSKSAFYDNIESMLKKIEEPNADLNGAKFISKLYYNGNDILKREFLFENLYEGEEVDQSLISLTTITDSNERYYELVDKSNSYITEYKDVVKVDKTKEVHNISVETSYVDSIEGKKQIQNICEITVDKSNKDKAIITIVPDKTLIGEGDMQAVITFEKINEQKSAAIFNATVKQGTDEISFDISLTAEENVAIQKKEIPESNVVNLNTISKTDFENNVMVKVKENLIVLASKVNQKIPLSVLLLPMMGGNQ